MTGFHVDEQLCFSDGEVGGPQNIFLTVLEATNITSIRGAQSLVGLSGPLFRNAKAIHFLKMEGRGWS